MPVLNAEYISSTLDSYKGFTLLELKTLLGLKY